MFPLKNIRNHLTKKLEEIGVLKKFDTESTDSSFKIIERAKQSIDENEKIPLVEIQIKNMPKQNVWIFHNEFKHEALRSAGKKVETTIIYLNSNRLYLFMIEMKKTVSPKKMQDNVIKKFESSLVTLSIFIAASTDFYQFKDTTIYPVGICCYNYFEGEQSSRNNDPRRTEGRVRSEYNKEKRMIPLKVEPLTLNSMDIPVFFKENPNRDPVTESFEIDLENILEGILNT